MGKGRQLTFYLLVGLFTTAAWSQSAVAKFHGQPLNGIPLLVSPMESSPNREPVWVQVEYRAEPRGKPLFRECAERIWPMGANYLAILGTTGQRLTADILDRGMVWVRLESKTLKLPGSWMKVYPRRDSRVWINGRSEDLSAAIREIAVAASSEDLSSMMEEWIPCLPAVLPNISPDEKPGAFPGILIDHPVDPENRLLRQFDLTGPQARVMFEGEVMLNARGEATVELPPYFSALTRDGLLQLTPMTVSMPYLHGSEFREDRFVILGGVPAGKVNWMVTAERNDPRARTNRIYQPVEDEKGGPGLPPRGSYQCPECYAGKTVPAKERKSDDSHQY